jgi:hypothetical protein
MLVRSEAQRPVRCLNSADVVVKGREFWLASASERNLAS